MISYAVNYGKDDISLSDNSSDMSTAYTELADYLSKQTATLTVYDQNNNKIFESSLSADDAYDSAKVF